MPHSMGKVLNRFCIISSIMKSIIIYEMLWKVYSVEYLCLECINRVLKKHFILHYKATKKNFVKKWSQKSVWGCFNYTSLRPILDLECNLYRVI